MDNAYVLGLDGAGRVHVGSNSCGDGFPTTPGAYRQARTPAADASDPNNECDVAIARFAESAGGFTLAYGTYLGGSGADFVAGLAVTSSGADWVVGGTTSGNFPTSAGARQATNGGGFDAFVARLAPGGGSLGYSTYLGGAAYDYPYDVALDGSGNAYVAGRTESADFPTTLGAFQRVSAGGSDGFVAKFNGTGSLAWSTRLGGSGFDWPFAVAVDSTGAPYVAGQTDSSTSRPSFPSRQARAAPRTRSSRRSPRPVRGCCGRPCWAVRASTRPTAWRGTHKAEYWIAGVTAGGITPTADAAQPVFGGGSTDALLARVDESAAIRVLPAQLNFLRTRLGRTRGPRQVFVANDGRAPVDILGIALGGSNPGDYAISNDCPVVLDPGQSCAVAVTFVPVATGSRSATLLVSTSASAVPSSVPLAGPGF